MQVMKAGIVQFANQAAARTVPLCPVASVPAWTITHQFRPRSSGDVRVYEHRLMSDADSKSNMPGLQDSESAETLEMRVRRLYDEFGQRKPMGISAPNPQQPHYFLHRTFLGEQDLLIIFNTKRCRYQCTFCALPFKSKTTWIPGRDILMQFEYVLNELRHSLSVFDRLTLSNEGSVLDAETFSSEALLRIAKCSRELRRVRRLVLETRLEFVQPELLLTIRQANPRASVDILTGFESLDTYIRDAVLFKRETLHDFLSGLDRVAEGGAELTAYVLFKPDPAMTDDEAYKEAEASIDYLAKQCQQRSIPVVIRLNPMYAARGSKWARIASDTPEYRPPCLTDVLRLAEEKRRAGIRIFLGLSTEDLDEPAGSYRVREDYSHALLKKAIVFNSRGYRNLGKSE